MWSIFLGWDNKPIPDDKWDEAKERGLMYLWDVYTKRLSTSGAGYGHYHVYLVRVDAQNKKQTIDVGTVIGKERDWSAFDGRVLGVDGFATVRAATQYLLRAKGLVKER